MVLRHCAVTAVVVSELGIVKPLGCTTEIIAEPEFPRVIGTFAIPMPAGKLMLAGTEATVEVSLLTETLTARGPASNWPVGCGELVASSNATNRFTLVMIPPALP